MLNITQTKKEIKLVPEGTHVARLYSIVDLGSHEKPAQYQNKDYVQYQSKLRLTFELPNEKEEFDGVMKPLVIGGLYTMSLADESKLKPIIEGLRGKTLTEAEKANFSGDDFKALLGTPCMLSVLHKEDKGKMFSNISTVAPMPKGFDCPAQVNPNVLYEVSEGRSENFKSLPEFMRKKIEESKEFTSPSAKSDDESLAQVVDDYSSVPF